MITKISSGIEPAVKAKFKRNGVAEVVEIFEGHRYYNPVFTVTNSIRFEDGTVLEVPNKDLIFA